MDSISRQMARFALGLDYNDLPPDAVKEAKMLLLDSIGCALASMNTPDMHHAYAYIKDLGGHEQATVIGHGTKTNIPNATFMNALLVQTCDNTPREHVPSSMVPAVLAAGEYMFAQGVDIIAGIVAAYELEMRLVPGSSMQEQGWHHASLTQLVSPIVASKMLQLTEDQTIAAIGISGSSHFTLGCVETGHMKNTADPMATEAGVRAAMLATIGQTGPADVFEGKDGIFQTIGKWDSAKILGGLGEEWHITTIPLLEEENIARFRSNASGILSEEKIEQVIEATADLENLSAKKYMELLTRDIDE